jgi:hypothetical protein
MRAEQGEATRGRRSFFAMTFARLRPAGGFDDGGRHGARKHPLFARFAGRERQKAADPVTVAVFAINQVGPAVVRACASGVEVRVATTDEAMAAVIRAALAETARHRPTDPLIRVVIS